MGLHPDIGRQFEFDFRARFVAEPDTLAEEIQPVDEPDPRDRAGVVEIAMRGHTVGLHFEDHRRLIHGLAAPP
jgi:hypothetical protein